MKKEQKNFALLNGIYKKEKWRNTANFNDLLFVI